MATNLFDRNSHSSHSSHSSQNDSDVSDRAAINICDDLPGTAMDYHEAVELVNRLTIAAPDNAMDVAVAVVEVISESASSLVDAMSEGDESVDKEWMTSMSDKSKN
jgi:hypothetical protein